jgi:hypothetical protein
MISTLPTLECDAEQLLGCVPDYGLANLADVARAHAEAWRRLAVYAASRANLHDEDEGRVSTAW